MFPAIDKPALEKAAEKAQQATLDHISAVGYKEPLEPECAPDGALARIMVGIEQSTPISRA